MTDESLAAAPEKGRGVQSVEVGARLLAALVDERKSMMLKHIAQQAGIAPAQAHPYLVSLCHLRLVEQDRSGRYRLGPFALDIGIARMRGLDRTRVVNEAARRLRFDTGLSVAIVVWGSFGPTVIQLHESATQIHMNTRVGTVYSITGTASGRIFAAFSDTEAVRATLKAEARKEGAGLRVGQPQFLSRKTLDSIRRQGYAAISGQPVPGVAAIAAPIFDYSGKLEFVMTLIGSERQMTAEGIDPISSRLLGATQDVSLLLGYDGVRARPLDQGVSPD